MNYDEYAVIRDRFLMNGNRATFLQALVAFESVLAANPQDERWVRHGIGYAQKNLGRYLEAITTCEELIEEFQDFPYPYTNLGISFFHLGRWRESLGAHQDALRIYDETSRRDDGMVFSWIGIGNVFFRQRRFPEAVDAFENAIALNPLPQAYAGLGKAFAELEQYGDAIAAFQQI